MPTYEYRCKKCGYTFEEFQSMLDEPLKHVSNPDCPDGKKKCKVERVIGAGAGIIFKGSGFYETDYRSKEYKEKASQDSKPVATDSKKLKRNPPTKNRQRNRVSKTDFETAISEMNEEQAAHKIRGPFMIIARVAMLALFVLLLIVIKVTYQAHSHYSTACEAMAKSDRDEALWHFQWALRNYVPGLPTNRQAIEQIEKLALEWTEDGETEKGIEALKTLRATLYAIRSVYQPFPDTLRRTEDVLGAIPKEPTRETP